MLYSPFLWWLVVHKSDKHMMHFQLDLEGWLEESTLFPNQQICHPTTTDLYPGSKEDVSALSSIGEGWLDEKLDLSIFDFQDTWIEEPQDDSGKMMAEDASITTILDSLMDSNPVGTNAFTIENDVKILPDLENIAYEVLACGSILSPEGSEPNNFAEEPKSPPSEDFSSSVGSPTSSVCSYSDLSACLPDVKTEFFEYNGLLKKDFAVGNHQDPDISDSVESDQSSVGPIFSGTKKFKKTPYESKKAARRERKKVQNKEAAARYRTKKRNEDKELGDEVQKLESEQKVLQTKHDQLKNEVSYLKSLMREMFARKGVLK